MQRMNITAVVVLYRLRPEKSPTIASLVRSWEHCQNKDLDLKLIIYDNSPEVQDWPVVLPFKHQYIHDANNGGLSAAYNYALESDAGDGYQWLLLLDQDSDLSIDFITLTWHGASTIGHDPEVVAVVPHVMHKGLPISPAKLLWGWKIRPIYNFGRGICTDPVTAINSGSMVRKSFVSEIGGFNKQFRLDYLDHWLFAEINRLGKKVYITEAVINHDLSIGNSNHPVSAERYVSILKAETHFYRAYSNVANYNCHLFNLALRAGRQYILGPRQFSRLTVRHLLSTINNRWDS